MEWVYLVIALVGAVIASVWLAVHYIKGDLPNVSISDKDVISTFLGLFNTFYDDDD